MRIARSLSLVVIAVALAACTGAAPGWTYAPAPSVTPPPSVAPSDGAPSEEPSGAPGAIEITALNIEFDKTELSAPADTAFQIVFHNNDNGIPHNVEIKDAGTSLFTGEIFNGVDTRTYDVPALSAKAYEFLCTVHPAMAGTLNVQ